MQNEMVEVQVIPGTQGWRSGGGGGQGWDLLTLLEKCLTTPPPQFLAYLFPAPESCQSLISKDYEIICKPPGPVVLEKTLESPLDSKEIKTVNPKGNQP